VPCPAHAQNPFQRLSSTIVPYDCFAIAAPGLEPLVASELAALGLTSLDTIAGGVAFHATSEHLYRANLWLRTASRVIVRLARFHASAFYELERHARRISFERFIAPGTPVELSVTCHKSRLYHSDAVAERIAVALAARVGSPVTTTEAGALVHVRLVHDECTVSLDSSGELLHRRGYRLATAKAPLRETVAAALIAVSGWDGATALVDPFCGSGTIAIEAALIARRRAPGLGRTFAFMRWPEYEAGTWAALTDRARELEKPAAGVPILAADRDAGGTEAARANAERARVDTDIEIRTQALSRLEPPAATGWLVTNPPWGLRVGDRDRLRDLYAKFGAVARDQLTGWHMALLAPAKSTLVRETRLPLAPELHTTNGGIPVAMLTGVVPE
jgi:putative N6-adenine-specific DNA methylase